MGDVSIHQYTSLISFNVEDLGWTFLSVTGFDLVKLGTLSLIR